MSARMVLAIASGAGGWAGRTGFVSSVLELKLPFLSSSRSDRAVEGRHHLQEGRFDVPTTCPAQFEWRAIQPFKSLEQNTCARTRATRAAARVRQA